MNRIFIIPFILMLISCNYGEEKFVRKVIKNNELTIKWYYYSYITNNSPDIISVMKNNIEYEIYTANDLITDVLLDEKRIVIKLYKAERGLPSEKIIKNKIVGYEVLLDSSATDDEYIKRPNGIKEKRE